MKIFDKPEDKTPGTFTINNKDIICPYCQNDQFIKSSALLNTAGMTFLGLDWANKSAVTFICSNCGHIEWFLNPKDI